MRAPQDHPGDHQERRPRSFIASGIGGLLWAVGVTVAGHQMGGIGFVRDHVETILLGIVFVSILPIFVHVARERRAARHEVPSAQGHESE